LLDHKNFVDLQTQFHTGIGFVYVFVNED